MKTNNPAIPAVGPALNLKALQSALGALILCTALSALAQRDDSPRPPNGQPPPPGNAGPRPGEPGFDGPPRFGQGDFGPGGPGRGGFGGMGGLRQETKLVKQFDKDGDKRLNAAERKAAREFLQKERAEGRGQRGFGGPRGGRGGFGGRGESLSTLEPGPKVSPADVKSFPNAPLYDARTLRTFFLEFEEADWEKELIEFHNTDVEVPAKLTVDGKTYPDVGVHFRGMSSFGVGEGRKHSLNLSLDFAHEKQQIGGYRTLNLLNSHEDPSFLRSVLYYQVAREYLPAPKANFARVVINGESWGVYVNAQQFNKDFVNDWFGTTKGARWKVPGSPGGRGSLAYLGNDVAAYKRSYEIKTKDNDKSWTDLIKLCQVLNETPVDKLEQALAPLLDIDGALKFLALENALINNDGYWIRTSDYSIYEDEKGKFHVFPYDANETFSAAGGPGFGGGPGGRGGGRGFGGGPGDFAGRGGGRGPGGFGGGPRADGVKLDPLLMANDPNKPLISKLLAVPALRSRYLGYVRDIAEKWLDWKNLGPVAEQYQSLIAGEVKVDTRKLESTEAFLKSLAADGAGQGGPGGFGGRGTISLKNFADQRRAYLLENADVKKASR